jgi:hypothetical protein
LHQWFAFGDVANFLPAPLFEFQNPVQLRGKAERNRRPAAFPEVHVWRLANEKISVFREFQGDEQTEDRFWS